MSSTRKQSGFSLIELMMVLVIIAIIMTIAVPSYRDSAKRTNRVAAEEFVQRIANREKQFLLDFRGYATLAQLGMTVPSEVSDHYCITVAVTGPPPGFDITAVARDSSGVQNGEPSFTLDQTGTITETGWIAGTCA